MIAGVIAGEGSFSIRPNNGGTSWACGFSLKMRDDNLGLLGEMQETVGCGYLYRAPARAGSRPQLAWCIQSVRDCRQLERFLAGAPLLSKKRGDLDLWRAALDRWTNAPLRSNRWTRMACVAGQLRQYRASENVVAQPAIGISPAYLDTFLAGFASAEAHFGATPSGHPRFIINLRRDDAAVLSLLRDHTGLGRLYSVAPRASSAAATSWRVMSVAETKLLAALLDKHPPVGKASEVYRAWRAVVNAAGPPHRVNGGSQTHVRREFARRLVQARAYRPTADAVSNPDPAAERTRHAVAALKAWSEVTSIPYTATRFEEWRRSRPERQPNRDTVARAFGSWRAALEAAGVLTEHARAPRSRARLRASRHPGEVERRQTICRAIRTCEEALGHEPRAMEFFRWRAATAPNLPAQATVYRAFPGGWQEALAAARQLL